MIDHSERCEEYMQVAALVCMDLDILMDLAESGELSNEQLLKQIKLVHENKEVAINDPQERWERYCASCTLFAAAAAGLVKSRNLRNL